MQSFCVLASGNGDGDGDCCESNSVSADSLCFVNIDRSASRCLKVRAAIETATVCNVTTAPSCPLSSFECLTPELTSPAKLLQIKRRDDKDFLFVGNAAEVYYYSQVRFSFRANRFCLLR